MSLEIIPFTPKPRARRKAECMEALFMLLDMMDTQDDTMVLMFSFLKAIAECSTRTKDAPTGATVEASEHESRVTLSHTTSITGYAAPVK